MEKGEADARWPAPAAPNPETCGQHAARPACRDQKKSSRAHQSGVRQAKKDGTGGRYKKEPLENGRLDLGFFPLRNGQRLQGQLLAALRTTASQHLAAILRRHSLAEAMLLAALTLLGLISSQHLPHTSYYPGLNGHRHRSNTKKDASGLCRCLSVMLRIRYIIDSDPVVCQAQF